MESYLVLIKEHVCDAVFNIIDSIAVRALHLTVDNLSSNKK